LTVEVTLANKDKSKALELATYDKKNADRAGNVGAKNKSGQFWISGGDGGVKVLHVDDEKICGEIDVDDKYLAVKGTFVAKLAK
jgi:hypothetical protein